MYAKEIEVINMWNCFFNATATTEIYTLSLHDALPISNARAQRSSAARLSPYAPPTWTTTTASGPRPIVSRRSARSEEHTSELQSRQYLVCRLLLEKK